MREIKFRAWDGKKMRTAFDLSQNPKYWWEENKDFPLMQFTGLHDKNGKEIYEGDICTVSLKFFDIKNEKTKVIFKDGCFYFQYGYSEDYVKSYKAWETDSIEVIGNIHDNPDLLKEVSHEA